MMTPKALHTRAQALAQCAFVAVTAFVCAGLLGAAVLVPAPPVVLPFILLVGIGCPMVAACGLPAAIASLRGRPRMDSRTLQALRRQLDSLPETQHPLGL
jgi:hypothetical protein